jgi:hypothetical protein
MASVLHKLYKQCRTHSTIQVRLGVMSIVCVSSGVCEIEGWSQRKRLSQGKNYISVEFEQHL